MAFKIRFRFDGKCCRHPRYNPIRDGRSVREADAILPVIPHEPHQTND